MKSEDYNSDPENGDKESRLKKRMVIEEERIYVSQLKAETKEETLTKEWNCRVLEELRSLQEKERKNYPQAKWADAIMAKT